MQNNNLSTSIDTLLAKFSITRFENESLEDVLKRYYWIKENFPSYKMFSIASNMSNELGITPKAMFMITLPTAPLTNLIYIKIIADRILVTIDETVNTLVFDETTSMYDVLVFLQQFSIYFDVEALPEYSLTLKAKNLLPTHNLNDYKLIRLNEYLNNKLNDQMIYDFVFSDGEIFSNKKETITEVINTGDYYFNLIGGNIISNDKATGMLFYNHFTFPFVLYYSPVKVYDYSHDYNYIYDEMLTEYGKHLQNRILQIHGIEWE